jgi:hypothetical protein
MRKEKPAFWCMAELAEGRLKNVKSSTCAAIWRAFVAAEGFVSGLSEPWAGESEERVADGEFLLFMRNDILDPEQTFGKGWLFGWKAECRGC